MSETKAQAMTVAEAKKVYAEAFTLFADALIAQEKEDKAKGGD